MITDIRQLLDRFPDVEIFTQEAHTACPWCAQAESSGERHEKNGIHFRGKDRLVLRFHDHSAFCRRCQIEGRGHNGNRFLPEIAAFFGETVNESEVITRTRSDTPPDTWNTTKVTFAHAQVDRKYWKKYGWSDAAINRFQLGWGELYSEDGAAHLIPMQIISEKGEKLSGFYLEARRKDLTTKHMRGAIRPFFWLVEDDAESKTIVISEGAKDGISAWEIGFKNFAAAFSANTFSREKLTLLRDRGYERVIVLGDHDVAGKHFSETLTLWGLSLKLEIAYVQWDDQKPDGFDITNLLETEKAEAWAYLNNHLHFPQKSEIIPIDNSKAEYVPDYKAIQTTYAPITAEMALPLETIRGTGPQSMRHSVLSFLESYPQRSLRQPGLKILAAGPGAGKTHTMIQIVERMARERMIQRYTERRLLVEQVEMTEKELSQEDDEDQHAFIQMEVTRLRKMLADFSLADIAWFSQYKNGFADLLENGADLNLWFNWFARTAENCENYELQAIMAAKGNQVGAFCQTSCQFREKCAISGYMSQYHKKKQRPITVYRHNHLIGEFFSGYNTLIVIDESPFHVIEEPNLVPPDTIYPHSDTWDYDIPDHRMVEAIRYFTEALRASIASNTGEKDRLAGRHNPRFVISGAAFLTLLDQNIRLLSNESWNLWDAANYIDLHTLNTVYQPNSYSNKVSDVKSRTVPDTFRAVMRELHAWKRDPNNAQPSQLHLVGGILEVYHIERIKIRGKTPLVIADATAFIISMYERLFDRESDAIYAPLILNTHAETKVIYGSDQTITTIMHHLGDQIKAREKIKMSPTVLDVAGDEFDLDDIPWTNTNFNNRLFAEYTDLLRELIGKHTSLLVISPKIIRGLLEDHFFGNDPSLKGRVWFNHYGNVRGTNAYKNLEAAVLIGQFRIPYRSMWRRIQAWANAFEMVEPIPFEFTFRAKPYQGQLDGYTYRTFTNPFAQEYVDMVEESEMIQAAERIRPHVGSDQKYVYLMASRPTLRWITSTTSKAAFLAQIRDFSPLNIVKEAIKASWVQTGSPLTKQQALVTFRVGSETYSRAMVLAQQELNMPIRAARGRKRKNTKEEPTNDPT
jgi:Toprim-like